MTDKERANKQIVTILRNQGFSHTEINSMSIYQRVRVSDYVGNKRDKNKTVLDYVYASNVKVNNYDNMYVSNYKTQK